MLLQILFVILCPEYDNLKQGKFIIPTFKQIRWLKQRKIYSLNHKEVMAFFMKSDRYNELELLKDQMRLAN